MIDTRKETARMMDAVNAKDFLSAKESFNSIIATKVNSALEAKRIDVASKMIKPNNGSQS